MPAREIFKTKTFVIRKKFALNFNFFNCTTANFLTVLFVFSKYLCYSWRKSLCFIYSKKSFKKIFRKFVSFLRLPSCADESFFLNFQKPSWFSERKIKLELNPSIWKKNILSIHQLFFKYLKKALSNKFCNIDKSFLAR